MKKIVFLTWGLILGLLTLSYAYKDGDFQVWNTDTQEFKIDNKAKIIFEEEFRWGGSAKDFYYQHYDLGFFYSLQKYLTLGVGYRQVLSKGGDKFLVENEPYLHAALLWDALDFKFEDRSRLEYNYFDYKDDTWKYRNKLTIRFPWKFTKFEIQPYLADEVFILFDDGQRLNMNRFSAGFGVVFTKNLKGEIYYLLQSSQSKGVWSDSNVLGTKLKLAF